MIGETIGGFLLLERIGCGGMGEVYRAEDEAGEIVAVKVVAGAFAADATARRRFAREVETLRRLRHPRIVGARSPLVDAQGRLLYAMDLVEGPSLAGLLAREGKLPVDRALGFAADVLEALDFAHRCGAVHRDVKPHNVLVGPDSRARLGDFGLVRAGSESGLTRAGAVLGTPEYLSPEQAEGLEATPASDVYATGILLHEMLAGRPPFTGEHPLAVLRMQVERRAPPLPSGTPAAVQALVARALAKRPADRFASAAAMLAEVVGIRSGRVGPSVRIPRRRLLAAASALAVAALAAWPFVWRRHDAPAAPREAPPAREVRVRVVLAGGETFEGELVRIDLERARLVTRDPDGRERVEPLATVRSYEKVGP